jgi:tRNA threonylcarbamoyladenosine biosynthesis protein TsaE
VNTKHVFLADEDAQLAFAADIARYCEPGTIIFLTGDLGSGKTTFVRGFLRQLGHSGVVKSPTYTLVEPYRIDQQNVFHFDLYRLADPEELEYAGGRDYFDDESICLIEWPEKAEGCLPKADILCALSYQNQGRQAEISAVSDKGALILQSISY